MVIIGIVENNFVLVNILWKIVMVIYVYLWVYIVFVEVKFVMFWL